MIAATNHDLQEAMKDGSFRDDLFFHLGVILMSLPPLKERGGDIILLAKAAMELGISRPTLYDLMEKFGIPKE